MQELKAIKVQQKAVPLQLAELQRNSTAAAAAASSAVTDLAAVRARLETAEAALALFTAKQAAADADRLLLAETDLRALRRRLVSHLSYYIELSLHSNTGCA